MKFFLKALQNYAVFSGRATRQEFWMFILFNVIFNIVTVILDTMLGTFDEQLGTGLIGGIYSLVVLIPSLSVAVRRMHDVGKSGWFILVPIYNFVLAVTEGDKGENRFGSVPA